MNVKHLLLGCLMLASCSPKSPMKSFESAPRGVQQAAALWTAQDGSPAEFDQLVADYYCETDSAKQALFESLSRIFENVG